MNDQPPSTAPDLGSVLKFAVPRIWKAKWPIAAASLLAAVVTLAVAASGKLDIWSGRAILTIGLAPASEFIAQRSGPAIVPIEGPRRTIARLSDPAFKDLIIKRATFEPTTAAISKSMIASSLRGVMLDGDREVAIELSAGSAADVQSAFRAVAGEIDAAHAAVLEKQLQIVQSRIDENKARIDAIEHEIGELSERAPVVSPLHRWSEPPRSRSMPMLILARNELQDLVRNDTALKRLSEPSTLHIDGANLAITHRSIETLQSSLLAGACMLVAMIILTIVVNPPRRATAGSSRVDSTGR